MEDILVLTPMREEIRDALAAKLPNAVLHFYAEEEVPKAVWNRATVLIGNPAPKRLMEMPNLRWLQLHSAGVDRYMHPAVFREELILTNAVGAYGQAVAEHMLALLLMMLKRLPAYYAQQQKGIWKSMGMVRSMTGLRIVILGFGDLGQAFGLRATALGAEVVGVRRTVSSDRVQGMQVVSTENSASVLSEAEVVALFLPSTSETCGLVNTSWLEQLSPGTILMNAGRGDCMDPNALVKALESGHLGGAILDVFPEEPLPSDHPLWYMENVLITPHVAGGFNMKETLDAVYNTILMNAGYYAAGQPLVNRYDSRSETTCAKRKEEVCNAGENS